MAKQFVARPLILPSTGEPLKAKSVPLVRPNNTEFDPKSFSLKPSIGVKRDSLVPCDTALELLNTIKKPVAVLSIAGPARTGKSYILSRFLGDSEAFQLGHTTDACTKGIWMSTSVLDYDKYCIILLDTEGIDALNDQASNDAKILVTALLLSSYFIYNSLGVPHGNDLEKMSLFTNLANSVIVRKGMDQSDSRYKCFPPFLWLLRDFLVRIPERYSTPTKFLQIEVLSGDDPDSVKVAVRKSLTQCFPSFECRTLPTPSTDINVMANVSASLKLLDSLFNQGVDELVAFVKQNIKAKQLFDETGTQCDGPTFALFVKEITEAANSPDSIPDLDNTWKMVVKSRCKAVQESLLVEYTKTMKERYAKISKGGLLEEVGDEKSLMEIHDTLWSEVKEKLHDEVRPLLALEVTEECTLETVTDQLEKQLIQTDGTGTDSCKLVVGGALFPFIEENRRRSREFCEQLFSELYAPIEKKVQTASEVEYTPEQLAADVETLLEKYSEESRGPEKGNVLAQMKTTIDKNKEFFEKHLHQVLQHAKQEREMQNELREAKENRKQVDENLKELKRQLEEIEERRQKEVKEVEERRVGEAKRLAEEVFKREIAEKEMKELEETYRRSKEEAIIQEKTAEIKLQEMQLLKKKQERELQNELREAKESRKQMDENFRGLRRQVEELKERKPIRVVEYGNGTDDTCTLI